MTKPPVYEVVVDDDELERRCPRVAALQLQAGFPPVTCVYRDGCKSRAACLEMGRCLGPPPCARRNLEQALRDADGKPVDGAQFVVVLAEDLREYLAETADEDDMPPRDPNDPCSCGGTISAHEPGCILGRTPVDTGSLKRSLTVR